METEKEEDNKVNPLTGGHIISGRMAQPFGHEVRLPVLQCRIPLAGAPPHPIGQSPLGSGGLDRNRYWFFFSVLAQLSRRPTVLLKTGRSGVESGSTQ